MLVGDLYLLEQEREESPTVYQWADNGTSVAVTFDVAKRLVDANDPGFLNPVDVSKGILGYATYVLPNQIGPVLPNALPTSSISRTMPLNLYDTPWLFATKITNMHGVGNRKLAAAAGVAVSQGGYRTFNNARFQHYRATVLFEAPNYDILPDGVVTNEYQRFTEKFVTPGIEVNLRRQGQYYMANGPESITPNPFSQGIYRRTPKSSILWRWLNVPARAVMLPNGVVGPNIMRGLGCVNHADFPPVVTGGDPSNFGQGIGGLLAQAQQLALQQNNPTSNTAFPKNTLLLTQVGFKPSIAPVNPLALGIINSNSPPRCWDITFSFQHFDPPQDPNYQYNGYAGHLLVPDGTSSLTCNYYYVASASRSTVSATRMAARKLYETYDFNRLFSPL